MADNYPPELEPDSEAIVAKCLDSGLVDFGIAIASMTLSHASPLNITGPPNLPSYVRIQSLVSERVHQSPRTSLGSV